MLILRSILLIYGLSGIFISGGLFFRNSGKKNLFLSLFILFLSCEMLEFLYGTSAVVHIIPYFHSILYFPVGFLYGPLLFAHFWVFFEKDLRIYHFIHLAPIFALIVYLWPVFNLPGLERMSFVDGHFFSIIMLINYLRMSHQMIYAISICVLIWSQKSKLNHDQKLYCILIAGIFFISTLLISWYTAYAETWRGDFINYYLLIATVSFIVGYLLYVDAHFFKKISAKYLNSGISENEMLAIKVELENAINSEPYLDNKLTLNSLSQRINKKPHHVSQTFSKLLKQSFHEYINSPRIAKAQKLLLDPEYDNFKIEAIGAEVGYNNKVTFNNAFKMHAGCTPSQFKKNQYQTIES